MAEAPLARKKLVRALVVAALFSGAVYAVLLVMSDGSEVLGALRDLSPLVLPGVLVLALAGFVVRAVRWRRLMRTVGYQTTSRDALYMQLAGQTMSVTPGRVGEVLKPWLAREISGMSMSTGLPLVFAERVADLIAVCLLALGGLSALGGDVWVLGAAIVGLVLGTVLASSKWFHDLALRVVGRSQWARRHAEAAQVISDTLRATLDWRVLVWSVPASVVAWGLEGLGFALTVRAMGLHGVDLAAEVSVYAVATIAGAFSFLPGGIGLTEASMAGVLIAVGMRASSASAATLIIRLGTLWWGVALGWIALASRPELWRRVSASALPDE